MKVSREMLPSVFTGSRKIITSIVALGGQAIEKLSLAGWDTGKTDSEGLLQVV
jgi:hypothetical protein